MMILATVLASPVQAQSPLVLSTAGASLGLSDGVEALFANPAHLGITQPTWVQLRVLGAGAGVHSNGLGLDDYRKYNGATLDDDDKSDILAKVPESGLSLWSEGSASALALRAGSWGLAVSGMGSARGNVDRDAIDLVLHGNADQPDWSFENSQGDGLAAWQVAVSHGRQLFSLNGGPVYGGLTASYVRGLYLARADEVRADLATQTTGLTGQATAEWVTADGGTGLGFDAGLAWQARPNLLVSFSAEHLYHSINWNSGTERSHYNLLFEDVTIDNFEDSLWESEEFTEAIGSFNEGLPAHLRLGAGLTAGRTRYSVEGSVWTADRFAATTTPSFAAAIEHKLGHSLPLRLGMSVGGRSKFAIGCGSGLHLGAFVWDLGIRFDRAIWIGSGSGLSIATAFDLAI
jgi:hypothetical protein